MLPRVARRLRLAGALLAAVLAVRCGLIREFTQPTELSIQRFAAAPADLQAGAATTLSWEVEGAETIEIDNGIGTVTAKGTRQVRPEWTTSFNLVARSGSSQATATVQVRVAPMSLGSPSPSPSPKPSPTPTPSPGASPSPSPSATPTPAPSPTPTPVNCGPPAEFAGNCVLTTVRPNALPAGECVEINQVTVAQSCPVGFATVRSVSFNTTAFSSRQLRWRRSVTSSDVLEPAGGTISRNGSTAVLLSDLVLDSAVTIEIVDGDRVLVAFTLRHY
jgi:hypothetical protein